MSESTRAGRLPEDAAVAQGALPPDDFHDAIPRTAEVADYSLEIEGVLAALGEQTAGLLVDPETLEEIAVALAAGHVVLQGPPGTGKSSLAAAVCSAFNVTPHSVTAHEDWTTYEVIGRRSIETTDDGRQRVVPVNGAFTEAALLCAGAVSRHFDDDAAPQAVWLVIDELNRAQADRAFGELFSLLGTDEAVAVELQHQREGNRRLVVPRRFRIVATINSVDRQFVNGLSQALRRRFSFITIGLPPRRPTGEAWQAHGEGLSLAGREFGLVMDRAAARVARKQDGDGAAYRTRLDAHHGLLADLFTMVEGVRYAGEASTAPHLPIGTAALIDTVELFLTRLVMSGPGSQSEEAAARAMDWAASVKLAPLFEADAVAPARLIVFAEALGKPFDTRFRAALREITSAGTAYVSGDGVAE